MKKYISIFMLFLLTTTTHCFAATGVDTAIIREHMTTITKSGQYRNHRNMEQLNKTAAYINAVFARYSDSVYFQEYVMNGKTYKNVICSFGREHKKRIIVGAHYDVCGDQEGADDNASGVVALLELARQLKDQKVNYRIDLVAYSLEEPPYFDTEHMGSFIHAKSLAASNANVYGMISMEMIGCFKDEKNSQSYPVNALSVIYGKKGNFITLVRKFGAGRFAHKFSRRFKRKAVVKTKKFTAPSTMGGIDLSDHANYWKFGFSAIMITDTSFYRNENYHRATDTMETLDLHRMGQVIDGVFTALLAL